MKEKFWSSDKILGLSAILISLGMFASIVYQNKLIQKQQNASVLPYLEIWNSSNLKHYKLLLVNNGIGPAFIRKVRIIYEEKTYELDPYNFFADHIRLRDTITDVFYSNVPLGRLIPAGQTIEMIGVEDSEENASKLREWFSDDSVVKVEIEFESVYGDRWLASGHGTEPKPMN